jgi:hypothetical protein
MTAIFNTSARGSLDPLERQFGGLDRAIVAVPLQNAGDGHGRGIRSDAERRCRTHERDDRRPLLSVDSVRVPRAFRAVTDHREPS